MTDGLDHRGSGKLHVFVDTPPAVVHKNIGPPTLSQCARSVKLLQCVDTLILFQFKQTHCDVVSSEASVPLVAIAAMFRNDEY